MATIYNRTNKEQNNLEHAFNNYGRVKGLLQTYFSIFNALPKSEKVLLAIKEPSPLLTHHHVEYNCACGSKSILDHLFVFSGQQTAFEVCIEELK